MPRSAFSTKCRPKVSAPTRLRLRLVKAHGSLNAQLLKDPHKGSSYSCTGILRPQPKHLQSMERARRFERPTPTLARLCSTPELRPLTDAHRINALLRATRLGKRAASSAFQWVQALTRYRVNPLASNGANRPRKAPKKPPFRARLQHLSTCQIPQSWSQLPLQLAATSSHWSAEPPHGPFKDS